MIKFIEVTRQKDKSKNIVKVYQPFLKKEIEQFEKIQKRYNKSKQHKLN